MRLQNDLVPSRAAPAAGMAFARFHEIDWTFVLRPPRAFYYAVPGLIHLYEAAGRKNRVHGEVVGTHVTISKIAVSKLGEIRKRYPSPLLYHAAQIARPLLVEPGIHPYRNLHRRQSRQRIRHMRFRWLH